MTKKLWTLLAGTALFAPLAQAQTNFPETEPNEPKAAANAVSCMVANDTITGNSTGGSTTVPGTASADYFRVKTCALPLAIYQHRLTITTAGTAGHTGNIRGLTQTGGAPNPGTDALLQSSSTVTTPPRYNQWYGFGKQEEITYRVTGTVSTTIDYVATLTTSPVIPGVIPGSFAAGTITVSSLGATTADTEIYLYDGLLNPIALGHNDDPFGTTGSPSIVTLTLAAGTYYVAISNFNTANNQGDAHPNEGWLTGALLDYPDVMTNNSTATTIICNFTVTDGATTTPVASTHASAYDVNWFAFTVTGVPPDPGVGYCFGDGLDPLVTVQTCPCANYGAANRGCASSFNSAGARITASGVTAGDDTAPVGTGCILHGDGMNITAGQMCIFLKGDMDAPGGIFFGDGTRCANGVLIRLRTEPITPNALPMGGVSDFPMAGDPLPLSTRGGTPPGSGATGYYTVYYRNAAAGFCPAPTGGTFNTANGYRITW